MILKLPQRPRSIRDLIWRASGWLLLLLLVLIALRLYPKPSLASFAPQSKTILAADGSLLRLTLASDQQFRLWTAREQIAPIFVEAMLLQEDQWFYWHPGVNPISLLRGAWSTYLSDVRQGGSTLTMQLARLLYRLDTKSPLGKLKQSALAIWLEARYSKKELLEAYLNYAPFGGNIQGIGAASLIYFNKQPAELTIAEAMTLAVIPQQPNLRPARGQSLVGARDRLLARWRHQHPENRQSLPDSDFDILGRDRQKLPFLAPHLVEQLLPQAAPGERLLSTLDLPLQRLLERQIRSHLAQQRSRGIRNAVAMLVDWRDQSVKAMVGSADYFDDDIAGQVNGALAKRSPGSTLKPFIYALALDQGVIHPLSMLKDAPTAFGPFTPENFDGRFAGPLSARDALNRSRNIPAVWLATQIKQPDLYELLRAAGVSALQPRSHYGLALVLGGGEVTMEELAQLYVMLANGGELKPLRYRRDAGIAPGTRLISPEASWLTLDMMSANTRPDAAAKKNARQWFTAWKTGTSWGFRDAWTAGVVGPYVLVVWLGNFDGEGNPALVGIETAAPLWLRIADALPLLSNQPEPVRPLPPALTKVDICSASGDLPNRWCPKIESGWFIPGKSPIRVSNLHRPVWIDPRTGKAICPPYGANAKEEVFEFWPSDLAHLFRQAGLPRRPPPTPADCHGDLPIAANDMPRITSPYIGLRYTLRQSHPEEMLALNAATAADAKTVFWFINNDFVGRSNPGTALGWRPTATGHYQITATDDRGRSSSRAIDADLVP
nr:penicillin-binding protein 1C [Permianibacter fluminis]